MIRFTLTKMVSRAVELIQFGSYVPPLVHLGIPFPTQDRPQLAVSFDLDLAVKADGKYE